MRKRGFFARLADLWRGFWGIKLEQTEVRHTEAVFHSAVRARIAQRDKLKQGVDRLVYLRNRADKERKVKEADLYVVGRALDKAALDDRDTEALQLLQKQRQLQSEVERLTADRDRLAEQAEAAKKSLKELSASIGALRREGEELGARKAHAEAQLQIKTTLEGAMAGLENGADEALANVRMAVERMESEAGFEAEHDGISMQTLRDQAQAEQDEQELADLKRTLRGRLLPERSVDPVVVTATTKVRTA